MLRYRVAKDVAAPAERVWELLADVEGWPRWTESMREIQRLDDGPLAVGSRARVRQPKGPRMVWTVTALDPGRNFTWTASSPGLAFEAGHLIDETEGGVRVTLEFTVTGPLAWLAAALAGSRVREYVDMESAGLKRAAETA